MKRLLDNLNVMLNLHCDRASQLLSARHERRLTLPERIGLRLHLGICGPCRRFARQIALLAQALRQLAQELDEGPALSPDQRQRLRDALRRAAQ